MNYFQVARRSGALRAILAAALATLLTACGGGGDAPSTEVQTNVQLVVVDGGSEGRVNHLFTTVTVCAPGAPSQCQTIDRVLVDTGSSGLRLFASVLSPDLALPQKVDSAGHALAECTRFGGGYIWGPVQGADVRLGGEFARDIAIHVLGDSPFPVADGCTSAGRSQNTVQLFGANGVLGVGPLDHDCGAACAARSDLDIYFSCAGTSCDSTTATLAQQVRNPVASLPVGNNGVLIQLPAIEGGHAETVTGSLIFGIGTHANNALEGAQVINVGPDGYMTTIYKGQTFMQSLIDSGSNANFFVDDSLVVCSSGFYCPASARELVANPQGSNASSTIVNFRVANADSLFTAAPGASAFDALAAPNPNPNGFIWGLPFFYGRKVFVALEGRSTPAGPGPWFAY